MSKLETCVKKEISKCLNTAIDCEVSSDYEQAYRFYVEGLSLVAEVLKKDLSCQQSELTLRDKCNLIQFAKQSLGRITGLIGEEEPDSDKKCDGGDLLLPDPSALRNTRNISPPPPYSPEDSLTKDKEMMSRYQRCVGLAGVLEKENVNMEMARQIIENNSLTRSNLIRATAWAMQSAHKKFQIQEKLSNGKLRESDFRKQQLYTISSQFNDGNTWLAQLNEDLSLYPNNEKITRELLDIVLTDNSHPIKATINQMQDKITEMITDAMVNPHAVSQANLFDEICKVIKEDINIIQEVLKALFEPLKTVRNSVLTSESVHHIYFSQIKPPLISLIKIIHRDVKKSLEEKMKTGQPQELAGSWNDCLNEAVSKLHYLTTLHNPYDMLDCTVHIIKLLANCNFDKEHCTSIGADDLLPRLCQVVVTCGLPSIYAEAYFMEAFMPSEKALGEEGYAVTMLQSSIAHLTHIGISNE